ncbi:hypothetical protein KSU1_C1052 [Candidatus Jettenia caeni]|uniref:Uncharacterized protein n=1 Tax=Candidatus Jettenia caeni TaxID=247490 RepID=I3ILQ3_9BACT|nr:hypothetical protein [Candidatus Jettenia sp. AMX1]GAB62648.1 hypothetical protein KSU1_C1052 [Candidatus Jettenia caeni]GIL19524.1 MAG: hypothetical protein BroJett041_06380 [Candidatus Jettenia caeni]GJQ44860.1 MAG: hypothetical protein JETCAE04_06140 [Candidatus Jettenia caeni]
MRIKVIAKIGNTYHPDLGLLVVGREYEIDETKFGDQLFDLVPEPPPPGGGEP